MNTCLFKISFPEERGDPELPAAAGRAETPARLTAQSFRGREQRRQNAFGKAFLLGWRNGRRSGLKIRWPLAVRVRVPSRVRCRRPRMREGGSDAAKRPPLSTRATPHKRIWRGRRPINSAPAPQFADFRKPETEISVRRGITRARLPRAPSRLLPQNPAGFLPYKLPLPAARRPFPAAGIETDARRFSGSSI